MVLLASRPPEREVALPPLVQGLLTPPRGSLCRSQTAVASWGWLVVDAPPPGGLLFHSEPPERQAGAEQRHLSVGG